MGHKSRESIQSGSNGITFECGKYRARITFNNKTIHIGSFETKEEEAVEARQKKAKELFGEFLNECEKPQEIEIELSINIKKKPDIKVN